jgi:hypothetical protein
MGKDDFVLLRKNIALEQLFNITFLALSIGMFFARFGYVLLHPEKKYLSPLVFLVFPYFPGLSLLSGMLGVIGFLFFLKMRKKIPFGRIMDFFCLALLTALPMGTLGSMFLSERKEYVVLFVVSLVYIFVAAVFLTILYPRLLLNELKEGSISLLFALTFCLIVLFKSMFLHVKGFWLFFGVEQIVLVVLFIACFGLLIKQELLGKKRK